MTAMAAPRKSVSIHDYPEHLNPFREDDNHNKIRFWTIGRKMSRSNSITFSGIKELRNSWSLRSFMKKGKKGEQAAAQSSKTTTSNHVNGGDSPIVFRRAMQYSSMSRSTVGSPESDRYVYGGSVTPLPRSRFQERLRCSHQDISSPSGTPRMARSDIMGSQLSVTSTNPFDEPPVPPVRASRRKKKRAPAPPLNTSVEESANVSVTSETVASETDTSKNEVEEDLDEMNLKIELKIVEDEDYNVNTSDVIHANDITNTESITSTSQVVSETKETEDDINRNNTSYNTSNVKEAESEDDILNKVSFSKIDISKYRRNSSVNEDDIRLRRGNLEDFHSLSNKRSKSLTNALDGSYIAYDINLDDDKNNNQNTEEPQKVICKIYEDRKQSIDNSLSSTEKEFIEIDKATRELEREISKLNSALNDDDLSLSESRLSVWDVRRKFEKNDASSPNPIPKPRRSHYGECSSPINNHVQS
ncbi:uncharacterized protein LOC126976793 [Leptidea sinapis]|uniref:uncharacterized protein LOC126976793 n=1 Tax=Leptidea sinapis TaxID=189913 RepID=UPI00212AF14C|nr:uncharacterized protein LOC126976793 [Leptidea sinapis]